MTGRLGGVTYTSDEKWGDSWARGSAGGESYKRLGSRRHLSRFLLHHSGRDSSPQLRRCGFFELCSFSFY